MKIEKQRMTFEMTNIYIKIDDLKFKILPRNTNTAKKIIKNLPLQGECQKWGKEYYFYTNLKMALEADAKQVIKLGEIAYWPAGNAIAIAYGKTPISSMNEIKLADKCNIWAHTEFDLNKLNTLINPKRIFIESLNL